MTPIRFAESNKTFLPPKDWPKGHNCHEVQAFMGAMKQGQGTVPVTITAWKPTPEELVRINLGEPVYLIQFCGGMVPVSLQVMTPFVAEQKTGDYEHEHEQE